VRFDLRFLRTLRKDTGEHGVEGHRSSLRSLARHGVGSRGERRDAPLDHARVKHARAHQVESSLDGVEPVLVVTGFEKRSPAGELVANYSDETVQARRRGVALLQELRRGGSERLVRHVDRMNLRLAGRGSRLFARGMGAASLREEKGDDSEVRE
jgi:hypothetical protein